MVIVKAETKDCREILSLFEAMEEERRSRNPHIQNNQYRYQRALETVQSELEKTSAQCWLAKDNRRLAGVIQGSLRTVSYYEGQIAMIDRWYVGQEERGKGIGKKLLDQFTSTMKRSGAAYVSCQLMTDQKVAQQIVLQNEFKEYMYRMQRWIAPGEEKRKRIPEDLPAAIGLLKKTDIPEVIPLLSGLEQTERQMDPNMKGSLFADRDQTVKKMEEIVKEGCSFVCRKNGRIVGYMEGKMAYVHSYAAASMILCKLYVEPGSRRQGYAHMLADALERRCRELSGDFLWLQVLQKNNTAIQFYRSIGFEIEAARYLKKLPIT